MGLSYYLYERFSRLASKQVIGHCTNNYFKCSIREKIYLRPQVIEILKALTYVVFAAENFVCADTETQRQTDRNKTGLCCENKFLDTT